MSLLVKSFMASAQVTEFIKREESLGEVNQRKVTRVPLFCFAVGGFLFSEESKGGGTLVGVGLAPKGGKVA